MYHIKIAKYAFKCPICGSTIKVGDAYTEDEHGTRTCLCQLPKRKLKPLSLSRESERQARINTRCQ